MIAQGFKIVYYDGCGHYPVMSISISETGLMIVMCTKSGMVVGDTVEWKHPLTILPY